MKGDPESDLGIDLKLYGKPPYKVHSSISQKCDILNALDHD